VATTSPTRATVPDARNGSARAGQLERLSDERLATLAGDGDERAFELLYERHHRALLSFCRHMLGNQEEGEDALQQTFMRAVRALRAGQRPGHTRGWLYAIARNCCRDALVARRDAPSAELDELPSTNGLADAVQARTDLRDMLGDVARLPDDQRAALVLAELGDLSQDQIGEVLGVRRERVKSLVYQARHTLIAERAARSESCADIRAELSVAHGPQLRRGRLKRHLRVCDGCRAFHGQVGTQHAAFAVLLPVVAGEALHGKVLGTALAAAKGATAVGGAAAGAGAVASIGASSGAGAGLSAAGGGMTVAGVATKATLAKLGVLALVAGAATGGVVAVDDDLGNHTPAPTVAAAQASDHGSSIGSTSVRPTAVRPPSTSTVSGVAALLTLKKKQLHKAHRHALARHRHRRRALRKLERRQVATTTPALRRHKTKRLQRIERHKAARELRRAKRQAKAETTTPAPSAGAPAKPRRRLHRRAITTA
jgi:RNA polymerase sigma factor (sigma-70 family)